MADLIRAPTMSVPAGLPAGTRREFEQLISQLQAQARQINKTFTDLEASIAAGGGGGTEPPPGGGMNLDYLGGYAPGTYNDGDIVIGDDGVAYLCVVDGTTTPPDPWPGSGSAMPATDAAFWTSTSHATLTAEVNFGGFPNGYVKSLVSAGYSNPITVPVIPLTDGGTGASDAPTARTNLGLGSMAVQNADNVAITGGSLAGNGGGLTNLNASALAFGVAAPQRLGSGTPSTATFLRGDGTWQVPPTGDVFPSGLMVLSLTPCPPGWTHIAWNGLFLRAVTSGAGNTGGSNDHSHGPGSFQAQNHQHDQGSLRVDSHSHGGGGSVSGTTSGAGGHDHDVNVSGTGTTAGPNQTYGANYDAGPVMITIPSGSHNHDFGVNSSGRTGWVNDHQHSFNGSFGIPNDAPGINGLTGNAGATSITGNSDAASNVPPYVDLYVCRKE